MKKLLAFMLCAVLMCAAPTVAFAEDVTDENVTTAEEAPTTEEIVTEDEITAAETMPETEPVTDAVTEPEAEPATEAVETEPVTEPVTEAAPVETEPVATEPVVTEAVVTEPVSTDTEADSVTLEEIQTYCDKLVEWVLASFEEISVIVTLIAGAYYSFRKHGWLNKAISTLNNNAVVIAEDSKSAISNALAEVKGMAKTVSEYKAMIEAALEEVRKSDEEKKRLEAALNQFESYLKTSKLANIELANEVAELLVLANIPNSKKEELYSRHVAAVGAITEAENAEVKTDDHGKEE